MYADELYRPQYVMFPQDSKGFAIDDQVYLGSSGLLIKPVVTESATEVDMYISDDQVSFPLRFRLLSLISR